MKTKKIFICMLAFILALFACNKNDLNLSSTRQLASTYYQYDDHLINALNGAYSPLQLENIRWGDNPWLWGSLAGDEAFAGGGSNVDQVGYQTTNTHTLPPSDPADLINLWQSYFQGINNCNQILYNVDPARSALSKETYAQAEFLEAYYYFYLARMFGGLPNLVGISTTPTTQIKRSSLDETYTFIETLLLDAIDKGLQQRTLGVYPTADNINPNNDPANGYATLGSAQALLGKVYMYHATYIDESGTQHNEQKYYASAITYLSAIANNSLYGLDPEFWHIFSPLNRHGIESIFEINFSKFQNPNAQGNALSTLCGPRTVANQVINDTIDYGWGFNAPRLGLVKLFKSENDMVRYNATIFDTASLQTWHNKYVNKYDVLNWDIHTPKETEGGFFDRKHYSDNRTIASAYGTNSNPIIVLRVADIYLLLAEAYNLTGDDADAQTYLNKVRARVGRAASSSTGAALLADIKLERHLELALEGDRYYDLVRWGDASKVLVANPDLPTIIDYNDQNLGSGPKAINHGLFPIPLAEISRTSGSFALKQNPGY
jgi:hypothetical protein